MEPCVADLHCQLDWVKNPHGNRPLGVSVRDFLDWVYWGGRTPAPALGGIIPWAKILDSEHHTSAHLSLLPDCRWRCDPCGWWHHYHLSGVPASVASLPGWAATLKHGKMNSSSFKLLVLGILWQHWEPHLTGHLKISVPRRMILCCLNSSWTIEILFFVHLSRDSSLQHTSFSPSIVLIQFNGKKLALFLRDQIGLFKYKILRKVKLEFRILQEVGLPSDCLKHFWGLCSETGGPPGKLQCTPAWLCRVGWKSPATVSLIHTRFPFQLGTVNLGLHFLPLTGAIGFYASHTERRDEERDVVAEDQGSMS